MKLGFVCAGIPGFARRAALGNTWFIIDRVRMRRICPPSLS